MINIYVCDDEIEMTDSIHKYIKEFFDEYPCEHKITVFNTGKSLYYAMKKNKPDVLFLDIELGDSHGIKVAKAIREFDKKVKIVFITSYKDYKSAAFSVRAFGYVDKPATKENIYKQMQDIIKYNHEENSTVELKFETTSGMINLEPKNIIYFVNEDRRIKICMFNHYYFIKQKISDLSKILEKYNFYSPHASFLVNLDYILDIRNYTVYLINDIEIPLSQRKSGDFHKVMNHYLKQSIDVNRR